MKTFYKHVDRRSRAAMVDYLENHFRYSTMNSWNGSTSYANNLKVYNLGLTQEQTNKLYELLSCEDAYTEIYDLCHDFAREHNWKWQAAFNGRSGGYLVLYQGDKEDTGYKSRCLICGQGNYTTVEESGNRCGCCGNHTRENLTEPLYRIVSFGRGTDGDADFETWSMWELRERVTLVEEFDKLCDKIVELAAYLADNYEVEEYSVPVYEPRKRLILKEAV